MLKGKCRPSFKKIVIFYEQEYGEQSSSLMDLLSEDPRNSQDLRENSIYQNYKVHGERVISLYKKNDLKNYLKVMGEKRLSKLDLSGLIERTKEVLKKKTESKKRKIVDTGDDTKRRKITPAVLFKKFQLKFSLGKASRTISVDGDMTIDSVLEYALSQFDFDFTHLYKIDLDDGTIIKGPLWAGKMVLMDGLDTEAVLGDLKLNEMGLEVRSNASIWYDFGDNWRLSFVVEKMEDVEEKTEKSLVAKKGKAPRQY